MNETNEPNGERRVTLNELDRLRLKESHEKMREVHAPMNRVADLLRQLSDEFLKVSKATQPVIEATQAFEQITNEIAERYGMDLSQGQINLLTGEYTEVVLAMSQEGEHHE